MKMAESFSVIIPAYKEERTIENTLIGIINQFEKNNFEFEVITVIDKAPNDKTLELVEKLSSQHTQIKLIAREGKKGVASAIVEGIKNSSKSVIIIAMGDTSEDPKDLSKLASKMEEGYDMVFANRFTGSLDFKRYPRKKYFVNRLCNFCIRIFFGINSKDITNAVKAYKTQILRNIKVTSSGFEIFAELPIRAYINGYKNFAEIPSSHDAGDPSSSNFEIYSEGPRYFKVILNCFLKK